MPTRVSPAGKHLKRKCIKQSYARAKTCKSLKKIQKKRWATAKLIGLKKAAPSPEHRKPAAGGNVCETKRTTTVTTVTTTAAAPSPKHSHAPATVTTHRRKTTTSVTTVLGGTRSKPKASSQLSKSKGVPKPKKRNKKKTASKSKQTKGSRRSKVYVLELEGGFVYVGKTSRSVQARFVEELYFCSHRGERTAVLFMLTRYHTGSTST